MTRRNRFAVLTTASLFALSLGVGAAFAAGEPDPPGAAARGHETAKAGRRPKESTQEEEGQEVRAGIPRRLPRAPTRWCRRANTRRPSRPSSRSMPTTRRTSRTTSATRRASSATTSVPSLVRARARGRPEARPHLAVLRHVARRAGQQAQGRRLPARRSARSAAPTARIPGPRRAAWKARVVLAPLRFTSSGTRRWPGGERASGQLRAPLTALVRLPWFRFISQSRYAGSPPSIGSTRIAGVVVGVQLLHGGAHAPRRARRGS